MSKDNYRYLDLARADASFEAWGGTLAEAFESAARALTSLMVDPSGVAPSRRKELELQAGTAESLLYDFLQELLFFKDAERLLFSRYELRVTPAAPWRLSGTLRGEPVDPGRHKLGVDVKAVTMHGFRLARQAAGWKATVVVDV